MGNWWLGLHWHEDQGIIGRSFKGSHEEDTLVVVRAYISLKYEDRSTRIFQSDDRGQNMFPDLGGDYGIQYH